LILNYDLIVIGAGINGLMIAHSFLRRYPDAKVAILERFSGPAPKQASSHGLIRVTRSAYTNVSEVKGMVRSLEEWGLLEQEFDDTFIHFKPMCFFGPPNGEITKYLKAIQQVASDIPDPLVEQIDVTKARRMYPQFRFENDSVVLSDNTAGTIFASETIRRLVERLQAAGVNFMFNTLVQSFEYKSKMYQIVTNHGDYHAHQLVVAAGPWVNQIVTCPPNRVTPIRQTVAYVKVAGLPTSTRIGEFPTWAYLGSGVNPIYYGLPAYGQQGLKVAQHVTEGLASDLDIDIVPVNSSIAQSLVDFVRAHFMVENVELLETEHCMYTCGINDRFIVDWLDEHQQGMIVGAGSGHMFKWAPYIGRIVTNMLTDGEPGTNEARDLLPLWSLRL